MSDHPQVLQPLDVLLVLEVIQDVGLCLCRVRTPVGQGPVLGHSVKVKERRISVVSINGNSLSFFVFVFCRCFFWVERKGPSITLLELLNKITPSPPPLVSCSTCVWDHE